MSTIRGFGCNNAEHDTRRSEPSASNGLELCGRICAYDCDRKSESLSTGTYFDKEEVMIQPQHFKTIHGLLVSADISLTTIRHDIRVGSECIYHQGFEGRETLQHN